MSKIKITKLLTWRKVPNKMKLIRVKFNKEIKRKNWRESPQEHLKNHY